jgi:hypothetical protein
MSLDKRLLSYDRTHVFKANGLYELPFGRGKMLGRNSNGILDRVIGGWQTGAVFIVSSGPPLTLSAQNTLNGYSPANALALFTPVILGSMQAGAVRRVGDGVVYFSGLKQIVDPAVANLTTLGNIRALSTLRAIASADGTPLLVNPAPGQLGNLGLATFRAPGFIQLDVNLIKRIRINERFELQLGATARNITNTENFGAPTTSNTSINNVNFGRITATATGAVPRIIVLQGRINF